RLLRAVGHTGIDATARVNPGVFLGARAGLVMGPRAFINYDCFLDLGAPITMGADAGLGYGTMLITCGHDLGPSNRRWGTAANAPIHIGEGAWIGSRVTILPGVTVGRGCVIASGAVVAADCAPDGLYGGVPARRLRDLDPGGGG
ncbi:MAG: DapH/DapD/GlmU-related protein, partial [Aeromicrobium sp.]